jgi:hypothetical protein
MLNIKLSSRTHHWQGNEQKWNYDVTGNLSVTRTSSETAWEKLCFLGEHSGSTHIFVRFEVFTVVTMKNGVFWDVTPCGSCKNRRFGGTYGLLQQGDKNRWTRNNISCN